MSRAQRTRRPSTRIQLSPKQANIYTSLALGDSHHAEMHTVPFQQVSMAKMSADNG